MSFLLNELGVLYTERFLCSFKEPVNIAHHPDYPIRPCVPTAAGRGEKLTKTAREEGTNYSEDCWAANCTDHLQAVLCFFFFFFAAVGIQCLHGAILRLH